MLKISAIALSEQQVILRLDGQVTGAWVELLRNCAETVLGMGVQLTVDLTHVSFVGRGGLVLIKRLTSRGVQLKNISPL